ncbi:uncharacterized protein ARMOST_17068 [Armillaria ostoyae]|uniref:Uncharacterized protein n=1 Tax=Armillaria ostoyae TaxID=47428 RepID=A0A284RY02_ARMOS|nr:uncharacterized protein ARMOST_17068 [Armillaria ostoyae]
MDFIARLDDDILLEIFLRICLEKPQNEYPKAPYSALQLSLVCSHWRAVALSFPRLWTNITVLFSAEASRDGDPGPAECAHHAMIQEEITNLYVQRSRGWLISIFVCTGKGHRRPKWPVPPICVFPISDRQIDLLCQATGWKEISFLSVSWHEQDRSWCRWLEKGALCWKTVDTVMLPGRTRLYESPAFSLAPNLRTFSFHGLGCCRSVAHYASSQTAFPFKRIHSLTINSPPDGEVVTRDTIHTIRHALRYFPHIRNLTVELPPTHHVYAIPTMLSLSFLTSLTLWVDYANQGMVKDFISNISLPCLHSFGLKYVNNIVQYPFPEEYVIIFLSTCSCSLRSFKLEKVPIRASTLINILSVVPELTHLEIRDPVLGSFISYCPVSQALATYIEANPMFLTDLEAVVLIWQREDTEGKLEKALMEMVETRRVYRKLKEVSIGRLNPYEEISVDTNHRLTALKQG